MQVLQLIKAHLISLLCGVFAIAFVALGVLGMSSDTVVSDMQQVIQETGAANIRSLRNDPKNEALIAEKKAEGEKFDEEYEKTLKVAKRINRREVLMGGVFPEPEKVKLRFEFKELYDKATRVLPRYANLEGGMLPNQAEIQEEAQNVEELIQQEEERRAEEVGEEGGRTPTASPRALTRESPYGRPGAYPGPGYGPPAVTMAGGRHIAAPSPRMGGPSGVRTAQATVTRSDEPKYDAYYRARVAKAKSILCYYEEGTFHVSPLVYQEAAPSPEEMWYAQVGLWVQQDVVQAIAALNRRAAGQVSDIDACVEDVPVKRIVLLRVLGYEAPAAVGRVPFNAADSVVGVNLGQNVGGPSFTGRRSNEQFDVVRFVLLVVVDQRELLQLINEISRVNFYQCLSASYEAVDRAADENQGYFYGTDPVVRATLEFEGYMARELYQELMPAGVRKVLGIESE